MYPEICKVGPFTIFSYGLMLVVAFSVSVSLACRKAASKNIEPDRIFNLAFLSFISGVIGARIFYVIENFGYYAREPIEIIKLQHGGLSWFGGLAAGSIAAAVYIKKNKLGVYRVLDLIAPFIALAQAIGRVGCFLNGCCYGKESSAGIYFPAHDKTLIPTQLYSSLLLLAIFLVLRVLQDRPHRDGEVVFTYLLLYSLKRFFIEFWRADNPAIFHHLTLFQLISLALFCAAFIKLILIRIKR